MWAAHNLEKTPLLLAHGANVNVVSDDFRSPLMIAARRPGNVVTVKLLLSRGAKMSPNAHPETASWPLLEAATAGDADNLAALLEHGARPKMDAEQVLTMAAATHCDRCVDLLAAADHGQNRVHGSAAGCGIWRGSAFGEDLSGPRCGCDGGRPVWLQGPNACSDEQSATAGHLRASDVFPQRPYTQLLP